VELCGLAMTSSAAVLDEGAPLARARSVPLRPQPHSQPSERIRGSAAQPAASATAAATEDPRSLARLRSAGRTAAAKAAGLDDAAGLEDPAAQWLGRADVPLQELSECCWWTRLPAPSSRAGFADSALWAADPPGAPFVGVASLEFRLRVAGRELPKTFQVEVDSRVRCSRVVFVVVKSERSVAMLREGGVGGRDVGAEEASQTYRTLVGGIWRHFTEPRLDDMDPYTACWEHGLLLAFMLRRGQPQSERGRPIMVSSFRPRLAIVALRELLPSVWNVGSRIQLWCFVGQIFAAMEELRVSAAAELSFVATPQMWEMYSLPRFRDRESRQALLRTWTEASGDRQHSTDFITSKAKADLIELIVKSAPPDTEDDISELQSKLRGFSLSALNRRALEAGVEPTFVQQALAPANFSRSTLPPQQLEVQTMSAFVAAGLRALYEGDCTSLRPTFGWIRALPLLCDFRIITNAAAAATMTGRVFTLPELEPIVAVPTEVDGVDTDLWSADALADAGHKLARSNSVRADEESFDHALQRAYALIAECETASERHQPAFESLRATLASSTDTEAKQILETVKDAEAKVENLGTHGREVGNSVREFDARTMPVRTERLKLIRKVGAGFSKSRREPRVSTLAGCGQGGHHDGPVMEMSSFQPEGLVSLGDGSIVFTDHSHCLRRICPDYEHGSTLVGMRGSGNRIGALEDAAFSTPKGVCLVGGDLIIADSANHCIRKVTLSGDQTVATLAGNTSRRSGFKSGVGTQALFNSPVAVAARANGVVVVCDRLNYCLRGVRPDGQTAVLAGVPQKKGTRDGSAKKSTGDDHALLIGPRGVATLSDGAVIFADGESIRLLASGEVTTLAGQPTTAGCSDGVGSAALFRGPTGLLERSPGVVLIADRGNNRICELNMNSLAVTTIAGTGEAGWLDGPSPLAQFNGPTHLCMLPDRTIAVSDCVGHRIRRLISPDSDDSAQVKYDSVTRHLLAATQELKQQISAWETPLTAAKRQISECAARTRHLNQRVLSVSFQTEAERAVVACLNQTATEEELYGFVLAAPSLADLCIVLTSARLPKVAATCFAEALHRRLDQNTNWDLLSAHQGAVELAALTEILLANPQIVGCTLIACAFGNKSFRLRFPHPCPHTLGLLEAAVKTVLGQHDSDAEAVSELERAIRVWLRERFTPRLFVEVPDEKNEGKSITTSRPAEDVLSEMLSNWVDVIQSWRETGMIKGTPLACRWLVATHVGGLCADASRGLAVLSSLPLLVTIAQAVPILPDIVRDVSMKVAEASRPAEVVQRLELDTVSGLEPPRHFSLLVPILLRVVERVIPLPKAKSDSEREYNRELGEVRRRTQTSQTQLIQGFTEATMVELMPHIDIWAPFTRFWAVGAVRWFGHSGVSDSTWAAIKNIVNGARSHFRMGFAQLQAGSLGVNVTKTVLHGAQMHLVPLFEALDLNDPGLLVSDLQQEITSAFVDIDQVNKIVTTLLPGSTEHNAIMRLKDAFTTLTVQQMRWFLRRAGTCGERICFAKLWNPPMVDPPMPIDAVLVHCVDWLLHQDLLGSSLFQFVWQSSVATRSPKSILDAARLIQQIAESIDDQTIAFGELRQLSVVLDSDNLARLSAARRGVAANVAWQAVRPDSSWVSGVADTLSAWQHLCNVCDNAQSIHDALRMIAVFGSRKCRAAVETVHGCVSRLEQIAAPAFDSRCLSELTELSAVASSIHRSLPSVNTELVSLITTESLDLLDWLRSEFADDRDFTSAIEIAVGRSEMECPAELWESGTPGRVAEEKLSQLSSVRNFLHPLAFRLDDTFETIEDLLTCVAAVELDRTDDKIKSMISETNALLIPLTELLSDQSDSSATSRLVQMMMPDRGATWLFEAGLDSGRISSSDLALTFVIPRASQSFTKLLRLPEILDWQSQIVLSSRGNQIAEESQAIITSFVASLDAAKEMMELLLQLHRAGHFDFQESWNTRHAVSDPDALRAEVSRLKNELRLWLAHTRSVRAANYFLNFFSMRQIFLMSQCLRGIERGTLREDVLQLLQATITQTSGDREDAELLLARIQTHFSASVDESPSGVLTACGAALDEALRSAPVRMRITQAAKLRADELERELKSGLSVLCSPQVLEHAVSAFARAGRLPERETLVFCHDTPIEMLTNLVLRWQSALENSRCPLYCIVQPDELSLGEQTRLAAAIRDALATQRSKPAALLLICSNDKSYIVSQFEARIVSAVPLPPTALRQVGHDISGARDGPGICAVYSTNAGAGKSFSIRTQCAQLRHQRVHVPVNGALSGAQLLTRIGQQMAALKTDSMAGTTLHLDLSSSVRKQFDFALFELTVLGSLVDTVSGHAFAWHPSETAITVEVASGTLLHNLRTCSVLELRRVIVGPKRFVTDAPSLSVGMGDDFANAQFDGCVTGAGQHGENAHGRLTFVVKTLQLQKTMGGSFPPNFVPGASSVSSLHSPVSALRTTLTFAWWVRIRYGDPLR
jgi:hypothetical protein